MEGKMKRCILLSAVTLLLFVSCLKPYNGDEYALEVPEFKGRVISTRIDAENGKEVITKITVKGNHYEMGYQQGYQLSNGVKKTTSSEWLVGIGDSFLGGMVKNSEYLSARQNEIIELLGHYVRRDRDEVPMIYHQQMRGVADGAIARIEEETGVSYSGLMDRQGKSLKERQLDEAKAHEIFGNISGDRVMLVNILFDVIMAIAYPIEVPSRGKDQVKYDLFYASLTQAVNKIASNGKKALEMEEFTISKEMHACDGVIVSGDAADNGGLYHSRSFMITEIIGKELVYIETQPTDGYYKTLNLAIPAFVGAVTAMNEKGLSIGLDMVAASQTTTRDVSLGTLLKIKALLEECGTLAEAVEKLDSYHAVSQTGTPWLFSMAGKVGTRGEVSGCSTYQPGDWGGVIYEDSPVAGAARWGDWVDSRYSDSQLTSYQFKKTIKDDKREFFTDGIYEGTMRLLNPDLTYQLPEIGVRELQCENDPRLLTVTNVFIHPDIQWNRRVGNLADHDSTFRHEKITLLARDLLEGRTPDNSNYKFTDDNKIGFEEMKYLVNYITPRQDKNPYWNVALQKPRWNHVDGKKFPKETFDECIEFCGRYYGGPYVHGSRTVFDNTNLKMTSIYGLWDTEWVDAGFDSE